MFSPRYVFLIVSACPLVRALSIVPHRQPNQSTGRRAALKSFLVGAAANSVTALNPKVLADEGETKMTFARYPQLRFIAALGNPKASSGTEARTWGLWRDDPGPRGVYLRDYDRKFKDGIAPGGWTLDRDSVWIEEHGLVMPSPGDLPMRSLRKSTKESLLYKRYVVTGDREITTVLTVHDDGRWELAKGTLYDVTHLPCRSAKYTPASGSSGTCKPTANDQSLFPVKPGAAMPNLGDTECNTLDYAVLFVLGEEVLN